MLRDHFRTLSFRLLAIFILLSGLFVFGAFKAVQVVYNSDAIRGLISGHLSLHVNYVREDIGLPPRIDRAIAITQSVPVDIRILGPGLDWASDPAFPRLDELKFGPSPNFSDDPSAWVDELKDVEFAEFEGHALLKMQQGDYDIVVATPRISDKREGPSLVTIIIGMGLTFLLIAYASVRWLFQPIGQIRVGAAHIGRGNFSHRIEKARHDELGYLASDINKLAGDVENMLDAKRSLLLAISHELRSPLSRMRLSLEFLEDEKSKADLTAEVIEMDKIVAALLEAERLNSRHAQLARQEVVVAGMVDKLLENFFSRDIDRLEVASIDENIVANIDEARVTLLLKNLLSNALRYSSASDGPIRLRAYAENKELVFVVQDSGKGLSADQARHIGEPFYRGDPSRTRDSGGTGLGLYLATLVAVAHGGSLRLLQTEQKGACFEVRLPLT
jgi:signal transduction histidine kinase